jgi:hypothetical protein
MIAAEVNGRDPKNAWDCRHLQISKLGHAVVKKTGRLDWIYGKNYAA